MSRILIVDDDAHICEVVQYALDREGFCTVTAHSGKAALEQAAATPVDLLVLDILMPDMDGLEVLRRLRVSCNVPVIFLSSKGEEIDRVVGLEVGGDDYITKPFSPRELVARVRAVLRRHDLAEQRASSSMQGEEQTLRLGPIVLDIGRHTVTCGGAPISLTATEFAVLEVLVRRPGQVRSRGVIVEQVYRAGHALTERTIDTYVRRIRSKFESAGHDPIETVHGVGYKAREP